MEYPPLSPHDSHSPPGIALQRSPPLVIIFGYILVFICQMQLPDLMRLFGPSFLHSVTIFIQSGAKHCLFSFLFPLAPWKAGIKRSEPNCCSSLLQLHDNREALLLHTPVFLMLAPPGNPASHLLFSSMEAVVTALQSLNLAQHLSHFIPVLIL